MEEVNALGNQARECGFCCVKRIGHDIVIFAGKKQPEFSVGMQDDRNVAIKDGMEGGDGVNPPSTPDGALRHFRIVNVSPV